jgi:DNA polymerase-1
MKRLFLVDSSSLFFRAFYAIRPLTSPSGLPVNAIYGYLSMILKLIKDERPDYLVFCYDRKEPSFRKDIYSEYKSNRSEMPEDLQKQMPHIKKVSELLGIKSYEEPGFEADDIIGCLSEWGLTQDLAVYIVSGDKDFAQLVKPNVFLYDTMKDTRIDAKGVVEKWGVSPEQFIDYLAIVGDTSDNIPGIKGIGPKGAIKLIEEYGTLEKVYENIDKIEGKLKIKLVENKENAFLSKILVTIKTDCLGDIKLDELNYKLNSNPDLDAWLDELNFKTFKKTIADLAGLPPLVHQAPTATVSVAAEERSKAHKTANVPPIRYVKENKSEQTSLNLDSIRIVDSATELDPAHSFFFLWDEHVYSILGSKDLVKLKLDKSWSEQFKNWPWSGFDLKSIWKKLGTNLDSIKVESDLMIDVNTLTSKDASTFIKAAKAMGQAELTDESTLSEVLDSVIHMRTLVTAQLKENDFGSVLRDVEYPLIPILAKIENAGFVVDTKQLSQYSDELQKQIVILEKRIYEVAGEEFNIGSPKQLSQVLFQKMGLESSKKTKTGFSTDNEVLEKLTHPIAPLILDYREITKLKSTYVDSLPNQVNPEDHRIHTTFSQALTATGRLSSNNPNLQNIPIKTERGRRVRQAFIAGPSHKILSVDYSQIELRILAHYSNDKGLIQAFENDLDIHAATASKVFGVPVSAVTSDLRRMAKAVNFGIAYGQGVFGLSETLGIPRAEATKIIADYFAKFSGVRSYIDDTIKYAHENGFVRTLLGRKRIISELSAKNPALKKFGERAAINAPIQGSASDIVKLAMIKLDSKIKSKMILQVHDELLFEADEETLQKELPIIKDVMENIVALKVPLKVNSQIALNWDEAH